MHVRYGTLANSHEVFESLGHEIISWTAIIARYAQHGYGQKVLNFLNRMQQEGFALNEVTFANALKACGTIRSVSKGIEFHARIAIQGVSERNNKIATALVDMYAKCGAISKAHQAFTELSIKDVVSWTVLVLAYAQHGLVEESLKCFQQMKCEGFYPNAVTFSCILKACQTADASWQGKVIHIEILQNCSENDHVLGNSLVNMYMKCGEFEIAGKVFDELPMQNVICRTALMSGYAQHGRSEEVLDLFYQMLQEGHSPNELTFATSLKACCNLLDVKKGKQLHAEIIAASFLKNDPVLATALIDMHAKCGAFVKAHEVFDELQSPNVISWNVLMNGYHEHGHNESACHCFKQMQYEGFCPDAATFSCILSVYGTLGAIRKGKEVHAVIMEKLFLGKNSILGNALVDMYAKCGKLANAVEVFDNLLVQDVVSVTALIAGYVQNGCHEKAISLFEKIDWKDDDSLSPDAMTFTCILQACGNVGAVEMGRKMHAEIVRKDMLRNDAVLGNALIDMYAKCGCLRNAREVFNGLQVRDIVSWTVLIAGYSQHGYAVEALNCFDQMQQEAYTANTAIYACTLQACGCIGAMQKGNEIHNDIINKGFLENDIMIGNALLSMYAKCGELSKAEELFDGLSRRDVVSWTALIMGYAQQGKHEVAFVLFRRMIGEGIKPDVVTFIAMLNACICSGLIYEGQSYLELMTRGYAISPMIEHHICMVALFANAGDIDGAMKEMEKLPSSKCLQVWYVLLGACNRLGNLELGRLAFGHALESNEVSAVTCLPYDYCSDPNMG